MNALTRPLVLLAVVSAALFGTRCSVEPVAGGTETGNPEVGVCASLVFEALSDTNAWSVCSYVPGGMQALDSTTIVNGGAYRHPDGALTKRRTERSDTVVGQYRYVTYTTYIDDTILLSDTSYRTDSIVVDTTVVDTYTTYDTVAVVEEGDTTSVVKAVLNTRMLHVSDTLFVVDTIVRTDTLLLLDTIVIRDTVDTSTVSAVPDTFAPLVSDSPINSVYVRGNEADTTAAPSAYLQLDMGESTASYLLVYEDATTGTDTVPMDSYSVTTTMAEATSLITKTLLTAGGAHIRESYSDVDGDGVLFGALGQRILYEHAYRFAADSMYAGVNFGAGPDNSFAIPLDNPIHFLLHRVSLTGATVETTYRCSSSTLAGDTLKLRTCEARTDSCLEMYTHSYRLVRGTNASIGNDDRLAGWQGNAIYNSGDIERIDITVQLDSPVVRGAVPTYGMVNALIWMRDKSVGVIDSAVVDIPAGTLSGEYVKNGENHPFIEKRTD